MRPQLAMEWPMVGRDDVVAELNDRLSRDGTCVVLAGSPGVGKTRLAKEALSAAKQRGQATLRISANPGLGSLPLGAFAPFLPPMTEVDLAKPQTLQQVSRAVLRRANGKPLTVLVDDAHLIDEVSAALTAQLVGIRGVTVILTVRTKVPAPEAIVNLWKDGLAHRIDIPPLEDSDIERIICTVLQGHVEATTLRLLVSHAQGNPLYLRELVLGAFSAGVLQEKVGLWCMRGSLYSDRLIEMILTDRVFELVEVRLRRLTPAEREALTVVAIGEPLSLSVVESIVGIEPLRSLEAHGMLSASDGNCEVRLAHPIYGDVIRARARPLAFREIYRILAAALEASTPTNPGDVLRVANWRLDGGCELHVDLALAAAYQARASGDPHLAEKMARAAVHAGAGFDGELLLAQLIWLQGRGDESADLLSHLSSAAITDNQRAILASTRMDVVGLGLGRIDEATRIGSAAEAHIQTPSARDEVTAKKAQLLLQAGATSQAWDLVEPLLERVAGRTLISAAITGTACLILMGRLWDAAKLNELGAAAYGQLADPGLTFGPRIHVVLQSMALRYAGQLEEAEALVENAKEKAVHENDHEALGLLCIELASIALARGRPESAARCAREALVLLEEQGAPSFLGVAQGLLIQGSALIQPAMSSEEGHRQLDALYASASRAYGSDALRAHAWVAAANGDIMSAAKLLEEAAARAQDNGDLMLEMLAWQDLTRLTGTVPNIERPLWLASQIDGGLAQTALRYLQAVRMADTDALEVVAAEFENTGADLLAAEALCTAAALVRRRQGQRRQVNALLRRAREIQQRCEGATTPALSTAVQSRALLARRELEVARLASRGWSNRKIAEHFSVSPRTIENQLQRVYEKLGVTQRCDLQAALSYDTTDAIALGE